MFFNEELNELKVFVKDFKKIVVKFVKKKDFIEDFEKEGWKTFR